MIEIVVNFIDPIITLGFTNIMLESKFSKRIEILLAIGVITLYACYVTIVNMLVDFEVLLGIGYFILTLAYAILFFKGDKQNRVLCGTLPMCLLIMSNMLVIAFVPIIFLVTVEQTLTVSSSIRTVSLCIAKILQFVSTGVAVLVLKNHTFSLEIREWTGFALIFILTATCGVFAFDMAIDLGDNVKEMTLIFISLSLVLINVFMVEFYIKFNKRSKMIAEYEKHSLNTQSEIQMAIKMQESNNQLATLRHDLRAQLGALKEYAVLSNSENICEYIDDIDSNVKNTLAKNRYLITNVESLNAILNSYMAKCGQKNINLCSEISEITLGEINQFDVCSVVVNLMDNAITGVENTENPSVKLKIFNKRGYLYIECENMFCGELNFEHGVYKTSKTNQEKHGFGLKSVQSIAKKYGGMMNVSHDKHKFTVKVYLAI